MIIQLQNDQAVACIDTMGAQLISLKDQAGLEYIWQRDPDIWKNCSPILFPIVGNLRDGKTRINGREYEIEKHGPCKTLEFQVVSADEREAVFFLTQDRFPEGTYPYEFELRVRYCLEGSRLTAALEVENRDKDSIWYCLGFHTGFRCPLNEEEKFEDYYLEFPEEQKYGYRRYDVERLEFDMSKEYPFPGKDGLRIPLTRELFANDAFWFDHPSSKSVSLKSEKGEKGVQVDYEDFDTVAFWTQTREDAAFLCIEPWNGSAVCSDEDNEFIHKNHIRKLETGKTAVYTMTVHLLGHR